MLTSDQPLENILFEYHGADLILRSHDSHHFRVPKSYVISSSPALDELIQKVLDPPNDVRGDASLPVVQLPDSGAILHSLLTFIFPVTPIVPSTTEKAMELLSVAQKYQMVAVMVRIRDRIAQQNPLSTRLDHALHMYSLAQKYGFRQEAVQAAQAILKHPVSIADLEDKLDMMPGTALYEFWKYYVEVRVILASDLRKFTTPANDISSALGSLRCSASGFSQIPPWPCNYITSIGNDPHLFNLVEFNMALARHMRDQGNSYRCACVSISSQIILNIWEELATVVHGSLKKAESALSLVQGRGDSQAKVNSITPPPEPLDIRVPDASLIIRSSDLVNFRVHKSVLAMVSPFFEDLLSLPQPSDSEIVDGLPVVQLSEDAELLNTLVSMLYPVRRVIPESYDKVLYSLAACQKYDMVQVQSYIRAEVERGSFPGPVGTEAFRAYSIACGKGLIPEMEKAARLTLDHPMTFETLGESLRFFDGSALRDLARFRMRCRDNLVTACLSSQVQTSGILNSWYCYSCRNHTSPRDPSGDCLQQLLSQNDDSKKRGFTNPVTPSEIHGECSKALQGCDTCKSCGRASERPATTGSTFNAELESQLAQILDKTRLIEDLGISDVSDAGS